MPSAPLTRLRRLTLIASLLLLAPAHAAAQPAPADSAGVPEPPAAPRSLEVPRTAGGTSATSPEPVRPDLVDWRGEAVVREERERMQRYTQLAESEAASARSRVIQAKATLDVKKAEIAALDQRLKEARKAKLDAERKALESEKKRHELMRDCFDRTLEMESAREDLARAQWDYGRSFGRVSDLELETLGLKERGDDGALLRAEQQYLEAWRITASAREKVAEREQALADRKLRVYKAWLAYSSGG